MESITQHINVETGAPEDFAAGKWKSVAEEGEPEEEGEYLVVLGRDNTPMQMHWDGEWDKEENERVLRYAKINA